MQKSFTTGERAFFKMDFGSLPVLVVLQNEDKLKESIREDEIHLKEDGSSVATDLEILNSFNSTVDALKSQLTDLPVQKYVHARNSTCPSPSSKIT